MILSDFLSRQKNDNSSLNKIILVSFDMYQGLEDNLYLGNLCTDKYLIQMQSQAKSSGIKLPEVHGVRKNLDPNLRPEKQHTLPKQGSLERLHVGQGRAGSKRKRPETINHAINQPSNFRVPTDQGNQGKWVFRHNQGKSLPIREFFPACQNCFC